MGTLDDILPQLSNVKFISMDDTTSGYWHVPLDLASSLLTTFRTPYGKFRWLRIPFSLKIASDVFQERLDQVLKLVPNSVGIADDIIIHGKDEIEHNANHITKTEYQEVTILSPMTAILWSEANPRRSNIFSLFLIFLFLIDTMTSVDCFFFNFFLFQRSNKNYCSSFGFSPSFFRN